jgi:hypothetical protein
MAGFKEGTVDGWGDDESDGSESESESDPEADATGLDETESDAIGPDETDSDAIRSETDSDVVSADAVRDGDTGGRGGDTSDIPWILRRNSITDGREQTVQLHLQEETMRVQRTQKSIIEGRLGESVRKADLREAALLIGLQQTDDVVKLLEEWGYALS